MEGSKNGLLIITVILNSSQHSCRQKIPTDKASIVRAWIDLICYIPRHAGTPAERQRKTLPAMMGPVFND